MIQFAKALSQPEPPVQPEPSKPTTKTLRPEGEPRGTDTNLHSKAALFYEKCIHYLEDMGRMLEAREEIDLRPGRKLVRHIISDQQTLLEELYYITHISDEIKEYSLSVHAVNVMLTSLILGIQLGYAKGELEDLGTAALFHGIGMYFIPKAIKLKVGKLTDEEMEYIRQHPERAYEELRRHGPEYHAIAEVIRQEHERLDGSGYPQGLKRDQIHEHAFIIGLLDIYQALINNRPYREKMSPAEAMKEIVRRSKGLFPKQIIKILLTQISIYPIKSYVRLNNSSVGVVVKTNNLWPLKPVIQIVYDAHGIRQTGKDKLIDLSKSPILFIKNVIPASELQ